MDWLVLEARQAFSPGRSCSKTERVTFWDGDPLVTEAGSLLCRIMYECYYKVVNPSIFQEGINRERDGERVRGHPHTHPAK